MSENHEYTTHQIVWATVQQFPAWPAKIVRKLSQHGKTVYKVNFFGDPSYCYLHEESLSVFSEFENEQIEVQEENLKLKRAIQLAKVSFAKQFQKICHFSTQSSHIQTQPQQLPTAFEQTQICSKEDIVLPQKIQLNQPISIIDNTFNFMDFSSITAQNVIETLDCYEKAKNTLALENLKRKQIICFQNDLKQKLLFKYKLNAVNFLKQSSKPINTSQNAASSLPHNTLVQKRCFKKQKNKNQGIKFQEKQMYMRKLQKILIRKGINRHSASKIGLKIVNEVQKIMGLQKSSSQSLLKQNLLKIMYEISCNMRQFQQIELDYFQKQIMSLINMEFQNLKIEQGSRITQTCEQFMT